MTLHCFDHCYFERTEKRDCTTVLDTVDDRDAIFRMPYRIFDDSVICLVATVATLDELQ